MYIKMDRRVDRHAVEQAGGEQARIHTSGADKQATRQICDRQAADRQMVDKQMGRGGRTDRWTYTYV